MGLSLDYIAKYVIIAISILIATGILMTISDQITGPETVINDENGETEVVDLEEDQDLPQRISRLIDMCDDMTADMYEAHTCFVVRWEDDEDIDKEDIQEELSDSLKERTDFKTDEYTGNSLIISFNFGTNKIEVEQ